MKSKVPWKCQSTFFRIGIWSQIVAARFCYQVHRISSSLSIENARIQLTLIVLKNFASYVVHYKTTTANKQTILLISLEIKKQVRQFIKDTISVFFSVVHYIALFYLIYWVPNNNRRFAGRQQSRAAMLFLKAEPKKISWMGILLSIRDPSKTKLKFEIHY